LLVTVRYIFHISPQLRPTSIEKEIFPGMAKDDNLFAYNLSGLLTQYTKKKHSFYLISHFIIQQIVTLSKLWS